MDNHDRILEVVRRHPGLDDDELSRLVGVMPRQQVNQICQRLAAQGHLTRRPGRKGKIVSLPLS